MAEMHKTKSGDWQTKCIDCHDPHLQGQLDWAIIDPSLKPDLYLATGKRGNGIVDYDPGTNTTTFDYTEADAQSAWLDPALWAAKSGATRGLILTIEDPSGSITFEVNSAVETNPIVQGTGNGAGTIEVQGEVPASFSSGSSFALLYGQLIRQQIVTPNTSVMNVKFFDPGITYSSGLVGGPADPLGATPEGICQVCHYYSRYHNYDRQQPDPAHIDFPDGARIPVTAHNQDTACHECHGTAEGFKPINADHTFMTSAGTTCANCHLASEDFVVDTHSGTCGTCHIEAPTLLETVITGTSGKWPSTPHAAGNCYDCHDNDGPGPDDITTDFTNHPKAFDSDGNPVNGFDGHDGQLLSTTTCTNNCHFHSNDSGGTRVPKDIVAEIHTGSPTPSDPCIKCHELVELSPGTYSGTQLTAKGTYSGSGKLIGSATAGQGDCANCHTAIATNWKNHPKQASHAGQVDDTGTALCFRCHQYNPSSPELIIDIVHANNCGNCHDGLNQGALRSLAASNGVGDCTNCHGSEFYLHDTSQFRTFNHQTYGLVTPEPVGSAVECMLCHNEGSSNPGGADMIYDVHSPILAPLEVPDPNFNVCAYCHDDQGFLIGSAAGHGVADLNGSPNTCSTCHTDHASGHPSHTIVGMNGTLVDIPSCVSCHDGEKTTVVHNNKCLLCHEALFRQQIATMRLGLPDPVTAGDLDGHLDCLECHTKLDNSFFSADSRTTGYKLGHSKVSDHLGKVDNVPGCSSCHDGEPLYDVHWGFGGILCGNCHTQTGELQGSASGRGTGKPAVGTDNDCMDCHGAFAQHSTLPIDLSHTLEVSLTPSCGITGCHAEADLVVGIHDLNGCATCHDSSRSTNVDPGSTVTDNVSTGLIATVTGSVDVGAVGAYIVSYDVVDDAGNPATQATRTVNVIP
nr:DUF5011 domain-containing protein [Desulfobulbaceae bacterium]